jgi:hypothetical protein
MNYIVIYTYPESKGQMYEKQFTSLQEALSFIDSSELSESHTLLIHIQGTITKVEG